jgi:hypothetical protein
MATVEESMLAAGADRIIVINTLLASRPGQMNHRWRIGGACSSQ